MSRFSAWVWKEWRERRIVLLALLGAVALITALPFVIDHWSVGRPLADLLCAFSVLLAMPVLGLNLFASETRHGTHALLLRTPGALRAAFAAKWAFLLGGTLLAFLVSHATRAVASAITGAPHAFVPYLDPDGTVHLRPGRLEPEHWFGVPGQVFLPLLAAGLGAWHVVGSVWARRGGAASLAGVLTLLVLATPMIVLASLHWWWLAMPPAMAVAALLAGGAAAVAVAAWSWGSGRRYLHPPRAAWTRGLAATAGLALVVTGGSAWSIDRWEAADEHAPEFRIGRAVLGAGGRYLYLDTWRGRPADGNYPDAVYATYRSTPRRGWRVDLRPSGSAQDAVAAKWSTYGPATPDGIPLALPVGPVPWLRRADSRQQAWAEARFPWVDAATGEESPSAPRDAPLTQDGLDAVARSRAR